MADIIVDTYKLKQYAQRLSAVNKRIHHLDCRLDSLYMRVGLVGLWNLMQADALTGYSWRLTRCESYLEQTAADFEYVEKKLTNQDSINFYEKVESDVQEIGYAIGVGVIKAAKKVKSVVSNVADSYYSKGTAYKVVQYGKAVLKGAKGVGKIVTGVGSLVGSGGLSTPVSVLSIISGCNDVYNAIMDGTYTYTGDYDKIGTDVLKDTMAEGGGIIGEWLGNKEVGENVGKAFYYGIDLVTSLAALDCTLDKVKQLSSTDFGKMGDELAEISKIDVSKLFTTDIETLKYHSKLAGYTYKSTKNFVSNVGALLGVADDAFSVGDKVNSIITVGLNDYKNPVLEIYDDTSKFKDVIGKGIKISTKVTKFLFG